MSANPTQSQPPGLSRPTPAAANQADPMCTPATRRPAELVMRLERLGSIHQSRLSFMRILTRRMQAEKWSITNRVFQVDAQGVGYALYSMSGPERTYTLVAFAHDLPDELRSDRVIATAWDATFALFDGLPTTADIERLSENVPVQEAGRISASELTLSRANRSVRLWEHVVDALAAGRQPDSQLIDSVGYLMRTTAVYGSGKFGALDRSSIAGRAEFSAPFQAEMLTVYLIRTFVRDLVQHMAHCRGGSNTATLDTALASRLGIGNSTGLGMAPFLINHPQLFNNWISAREEALKRVRNQTVASVCERDRFINLLQRSQHSFTLWNSDHPIQQAKVRELKLNMAALLDHVRNADLLNDYPWNRLYLWAAENLDIEAQECVVSLMMEPYPNLVDGMADCMSAPETVPARIDGSMPLTVLAQLIEEHYSWALELNWQERDNCARAWYVSEEKLEPRLGERFDEPIADYEQPLAPARDVALLYQAVKHCSDTDSTAKLLIKYPQHRHVVRRVQLVSRAPYAEIRDNTIAAALQPFDMLRCKLAFFGATNFDPRSDRWLRISLYANAPYPEELASADADSWIYPADDSVM